MRRTLLIGVALATIASACTSGKSTHAGSSARGSGQSAISNPGSSASAPGPVTTASPLVLRATLGEKVARWDPVLAVPFGERDDELGYQAPSESAATAPAGFVVAADGSFWIVDAAKARIAHFGRDGRFVGRVGTTHRPAEGIVASGDRIFVLLDAATGRLLELRPHSTRLISVNVDGRALRLSYHLSLDHEGLVVLSAGYADTETGSEGPVGYVRVDPGSGTATPLSGLPIGSRTFVRTEWTADDHMNLVSVLEGATLVQPIRFELVGTGGSDGRTIPGEFGSTELIPLDGDVAMYMKVSPSRPADQQRYGGGRWLLRMGRSPVLWERLPDPGVPDDTQRRHLAVGPDGSIYLIVLTKNGAKIYRRP